MINLGKIYHYRFKEIEQENKNLVWNEISEFIYNLLNKPKKILDPCAGSCEFLNPLEKTECWGVDIQNIILTKKKQHINAIVGDIFKVDIPQKYFDAIFISNFLEHLNSHEELLTFIQKMRNCLIESGKICILGPNFKYTYKKYFDYIDHKLILTHCSVAELLYSENFKIKKIYDKFLPYSFQSKLPASRLLTKLYLKMPYIWKMLGKQFLIVAEK